VVLLGTASVTLAQTPPRAIATATSLLAWTTHVDMSLAEAQQAQWNLFVDNQRTVTPMPPMVCTAGTPVTCTVTAPGWLASVTKGPHALTISATVAGLEGDQSDPLLIDFRVKPGKPGTLRITTIAAQGAVTIELRDVDLAVVQTSGPAPGQ
jgi:hypothetical protein